MVIGVIKRVACGFINCENYRLDKAVDYQQFREGSWKKCVRCGRPMIIVEQVDATRKSSGDSKRRRKYRH